MRELFMKIVGAAPTPAKPPELVKDTEKLSMGQIIFAIKLVSTKDYKN